MKLIFKYVVAAGLMGLTACAGVRGPSAPAPEKKPAEAALPTAPQQLIIFIPQTDQSAAAWLKLYDKFPQLRMTIAMSPRFKRFALEPALKERILALQQAGRLELALQLPNPPFLPLLINTDSAHAALPPGSPLPSPPFRQPEDATQIVARAKSEFVKTWGSAPKGLVVPQGAVNADLLKLLNQLGLTWAVGALGAPAHEGAYRSGLLLVWDATPVQENPHFMVQVWDERSTSNPTQSNQVLSGWAQKKGVTTILPSDPNLPASDLPENIRWGNRTWTTPDWSPWIGSPHKNAAWTWLRNTRDALEHFKNSGQASVRRLDMAFEEIYNAENANYFSGITEGETTFTMAEDREKEFKATLSSVYRLIGQSPPDNLFSTEGVISVTGFRASSTTLRWENVSDGRGHLTVEDPAGDDKGDGNLTGPLGDKTPAGQFDLRRLDVWVSSETLDVAISLGSLTGGTLGNFQTMGPLIDLYIDLNSQPNVGTSSLLPGRATNATPSDAWEYAFTLWGSQAQFYRTRGEDSYELSETVPLVFEPNRVRFSIPRAWLRGNPQRWGYQLLVLAYDPKSLENDVRPLSSPEMVVAHRLPIYDLIDPLDTPQNQLLIDIEEGKRNGIPSVRLPK